MTPPDQRYVIFSCTKALIAAVIWQLLRDGELRLDDTAAGYVEAFASNGKDGITIEQLLVHTGGFPTAPMPPADGADPNRRAERYARWRTTFEPGTHFEYHPTAGHWILADVIEAITGTDYRTVVHERAAARHTASTGSGSASRSTGRVTSPRSAVGEPPTPPSSRPSSASRSTSPTSSARSPPMRSSGSTTR
ncbi:MAG: serine hydrolase domain-containing protein [Acidimicrobiales bacterium]